MTRRGRWAAAAAVAVVVVTTAPTPGVAVAGPSTVLPAASATPVCQIRDARLNEISGLVATDEGFVVVNDGADEESRRRIFLLDADCAVVRTVRYPSRPRDTEDLGVGADGTIWVADIGDNDRSRSTVALWRLAPGAARPVLHRVAYPDGPHNAEALLVAGDGPPVIVTKQGGTAGLYRPAAPLRPGATVPLARVGQVRLPSTTTRNPFSFVGRGVVTGGATAPDGRRVVLRTYADAFEFDVTGGDMVEALTTGTPRVVALPNEPQGESIAYSPDGRSLLTVSETANEPPGTRPTILRYALTPTPTVSTRRPDPAPTASRSRPGDGGTDGVGDHAAGGAGDRRAAGDHADRGGTATLVVGGVGVALGLVTLGLVMVRGARRGGRPPGRP
ncbi:hypothetical protein [Micromonospora sp. RTGN7]|uniref:hypothetical protein n=1 Tax=Micromonospora sp. RTGN7 TaxID=3016526 RepID=UPI0029FEFDE3|nr:hypothetical protein [Micromonospora sp. RTGN7]